MTKRRNRVLCAGLIVALSAIICTCACFADAVINGQIWYTQNSQKLYLEGVNVALTPVNATATTDSSGRYSFSNLTQGAYTVIPAKSGWKFDPAQQTVAFDNVNDVNVDFEAWEDSATAVSVSPSTFIPTGENSADIVVTARTGLVGLYVEISGDGISQTVGLTEDPGSPGQYSAVWKGLDETTGKILNADYYIVRVCDAQSHFLTPTATITLSSVGDVSASPSTFYPTAGQSTTISAVGSAGLLLKAIITDSKGVEICSLPLSRTSGTYQAVWNGKDADGNIMPVGSYNIRICRTDTGVDYKATGSVSIGQAAAITGQVWYGTSFTMNRIESDHPYANNTDQSWIISSESGSRLRVHFVKVDTQRNYDHVYLYDSNSVQVADYSGSYTDFWSPWIDGNVTTVKFTSNSYTTASGFIIDKYVTNEQVEGLSGVSISSSPSGITATTADEGSFSATNISPATYTVTPSKAGWIFSPTNANVTITSVLGAQVEYEGREDHVTLVSATPSPFVPSGTSQAEIIVNAKAGQSGMIARVSNSSNGYSIDVPLSESTDGVYTGDWDGLDTSGVIVKSGSYTINVLNQYGIQFSKYSTLQVQGITSLSASPITFYPTSGQTATISVSGNSGLPLEAQITDNQGNLLNRIALAWTGSAYKGTWDGKDMNGDVQGSGSYTVRICRTDTGSPYALSATLKIGAGGTITGIVQSGTTYLQPAVESPHNYSSNTNQTWPVTADAGIRIKVHFSKIDTEFGCDTVYVQTSQGTTVTKYSGSYSDVWSPWVTGRTAKILLRSDSMNNYYGFTVDRYVTDDAAVGVPGVLVTLNPGNTTLTTDAEGKFNFTGLAPGSYTVTPSLADWNFFPASVAATLTEGSNVSPEFWGETAEQVNSISNAKSQRDGTLIRLKSMPVSAVYSGYFYIEDENRSSGICVVSDFAAVESKRVDIVGRIATVDGKRVILADEVKAADGTTEIMPLGLTNAALVRDSICSGLLIRTWGKIMSIDGKTYINDGSGANGGLGILLSTVDALEGRTIDLPNDGQYVSATGISNLGTERMIMPRVQDDIVLLNQQQAE